MMPRPRHLSWMWIGLLVLVPTQQGQALDIQGSVELDVRHSDNSRLNRDGEEDETQLRPSLNLSGSESGNRLSGEFNYRLEHREYLENTFDNDQFLTGTTAANLLISQGLNWSLTHSRTESTISSGGRDTPDNQQVTNVIRTGPRLEVPLSSTWFWRSGAQGMFLTADKTPNDSTRWIVDTGVNTRFAGGYDAGLTVDYSKVDFDSPFGNDFDSLRLSLVVGRGGDGQRLSFQARAGSNSTDRSRGQDIDEWTGSLDVDYRLSPQWSLNLGVARDVTDQLAQNTRGTAQFGDGFSDDSDIADAFVSESLDGALSFDGARFNGEFRLSFIDRESEEVGGDQSRSEARLRLGYPVSPRWNLNAFIARSNVEFDVTDRKDDQTRYGLRTSYEARSNLRLSLGVSYRERESDESDIESEETEINASIAYLFD